jgi:hypothetical protein
MLRRWPRRRDARLVVGAALLIVALIGCTDGAGGNNSPTPTAKATVSAPTNAPTDAPLTVTPDLGPSSWLLSVWSEEDQNHISIARDLATDTILRFPIGEQAIAIGPGRVATLQWNLEADAVTTIRLVDPRTGIETQRADIQGLVTSAAVRSNDVLFSVQGPGRDGGVWSLPSNSSVAQPVIPAGELPENADATVGGRYLLWISSTGNTVAADLLRDIDHVSIDLFVGEDEPRRVDLPERANIVGLTDDLAIVMNQDFLGAVKLVDGTYQWRIDVSSVGDFYLTPDGQSVIATLVPDEPQGPLPMHLVEITLSSGESRLIKMWSGDERFPTLWPQISTGDRAVVGLHGEFGDSLSGDWSAEGTAIRTSDGETEGTMNVNLQPVEVP